MILRITAPASRSRGAWLIMLGLLLASFVPQVAHAHPKPGAHADVRIAVQDHSVRMDLLMNIMFVDGLIYAPRRAMDDVAADEESALRAGLREYFRSSGGEITGVLAPDDSLAAIPRGVILDKPNRVRIDGVFVTPIEKEFAIVRPKPEERPGFEQNPLLLMPQVHVVLEYPCKQPPRVVEIVWGTYPLDFLVPEREVPPPVTVDAQLTAEGDIQAITLTREEPSYTWHGRGVSAADRMTRVPSLIVSSDRVVPALPVVAIGVWIVLSAGLVRVRRGQGALIGLLIAPVFGAAAWLGRDLGSISVECFLAPAVPSRPSDREAADIFTALQSNVYRAFDYTDESEIYDALAQSVDGPLLDAMYNQVYRSLVMYEEGGAVSRVKTVEPIAVEVLPTEAIAKPLPRDGRFTVEARWRVEGVVYHWGHSHTRWNEYAATYSVAPTGAGWRIVEYQTREQIRIDPATMKPPAGTEAGGRAPSDPQTGGTPAWHPNR